MQEFGKTSSEKHLLDVGEQAGENIHQVHTYGVVSVKAGSALWVHHGKASRHPIIQRCQDACAEEDTFALR